MKITEFDIKGPKLIELNIFRDSRGFFVERFQKEKFIELGIPWSFVQDNFSTSLPKVLRGLHYQFDPPQGKLVSCTRGQIYDVAVDIRKDSPTLGQSISVLLSGDHPQLFWIPPGFAHGFCVMGDEPADVLYKVDNLWKPGGEGSLLWNDPELRIDWPVKNPILSDKDAKAESFANYRKRPVF